ncbi:2,3-bisphosphoglycerate-independent phosphoglycerate mutase [Candidatus Woesearchaeota archaeon]|nr:2,3-bisphosphoglycerate-independent phosphoglycerate mutase [Candidatus Woesearchaeota archaeon]
MKRPIILIILDGWGLRKEREGNAILQANTPVFDILLEECPNSRLKASGEAVGLPERFQGNSEVGHMNIGAGRVMDEMLLRINKAINRKAFFRNPALLKSIVNCQNSNSTLHLMGLLQDQGVHAMNTHLYALIKMARMYNIQDIKIHIFADGRDTPPKSVLKYIRELKNKIKDLKMEYRTEIATIQGRYFAMDRDQRWDRDKLSYDCLAEAKGRKANTVEEAVHMAYENKETDEFIKPTVIKNFTGIKDKDSIIFFNYRLDRARQLTHAFIDPNFKFFRRKKLDITYTAFAHYYDELEHCKNTYIAFEPLKVKNILGEVLANNNLKQLRIAETEKYAHVTFFFNNEDETPFKGEDRIIIPSPKVATYDLRPEMSAKKITDKVIKQLPKYDVVILNFANADMVGHTGDIRAAIRGIETVDNCMGRILERIRELKGIAVITADHGNAEHMAGQTVKSHTTNPVPFIIYNYKDKKQIKLKNGKLADIAPTMLFLLGIKKPIEMTGNCLITR